MHVAEAGDPAAPPLVLLHGWPQHWLCWQAVLPPLAGSARLLLPDLRGHGWSDAPAGGYEKEQLATDLLGLLDALGLDRVGLVGHDWGGFVSLLAALRAPERVRGVLALGITHPFPRPALRWTDSWRFGYQVALALPVLGERALRATPRLVEEAVRQGCARRDAVDDEALRSYGAVLQEPARARASVRLYRESLLREGPATQRGRYTDRRLRVPVHLVGGARDPVVVPRLLGGAEPYADALTTEVVPGVGHFLPEEAPALVAERVAERLRRGLL